MNNEDKARAVLEGPVTVIPAEIEAMAEGKRLAVFVQETDKATDGQFIPCIAVEGERGYYRTNWAWGTDKSQADRLADEYNARLGLDPQEAMKIILSTLRGR